MVTCHFISNHQQQCYLITSRTGPVLNNQQSQESASIIETAISTTQHSKGELHGYESIM